MKPMRNSRLHLSVAAALTGLAALSGDALAIGSNTNTGQALVFPYYTVNDTWVTTFNVMNTSDKPVAVKVRFHEAKNSRDVLDFNIIMSPKDQWTGFLQDSDTGPQLFTTDNSCTSPARNVVNGAKASNIAYTGAFDDTGGDDDDRMREGYVEMLVMGIGTEDWDNTDNDGNPVYPTAYYAKHVNGEPRDCAKVDTAFIAQADPWQPGNDPENDPAGATADVDCARDVNLLNQNDPPTNGSGHPLAACDFVPLVDGESPLKGNLTWLHAQTGTGAGTEAIAVDQWLPGVNFVTAQQFPWFLEPTFASANGLWTVDGVALFEDPILFDVTLNEWADNENNGAATDWVITFPTKAYHVDKFNEQIQAAVSKYRNGLDAVVSTDGATTDPTADEATDCNDDRTKCDDNGAPLDLDPFDNLFGVEGEGDSKVTVSYTLYDREEGKIEQDGTSISPAPPGEFESLRYEANVLQFREGVGVLDSNFPIVIGASAALEGAPNGWAEVSFRNALPMAAFAVKERDRGEPGTAYGQAMDNGYVVD